MENEKQEYDSEVLALGNVYRAVAGLSPEATYRVLSHVCDSYEIGCYPPGTTLTASQQIASRKKT